MNSGNVGMGLVFGLLGCVLAGCGSPDSSNKDTGPKMGAATADCGTVQEPLELTLKDVKPAPGSSMPNTAIVQSFTIVGKLLELQPSFAFGAAHTAGAASPSPVVWTISVSGSDTVYTSQPMTYATAPAHVELNPPGLLETGNGCVSTLPTPTFSYDITAP